MLNHDIRCFFFFREGTIKVGDHLLAVDGVSLNGLTLADADAVLRQSDGACRLTVRYQVSAADRVGNATCPMLVEVESPRPHQLGLTLTNTINNSAVVVDHVKPGSIAERYGFVLYTYIICNVYYSIRSFMI